MRRLLVLLMVLGGAWALANGQENKACAEGQVDKVKLGEVDKVRLSDGWRFSFGDASSMVKDFGCGTEYFNYMTKAASIHNEGPYAPSFDDSSWQEVRVPHDWAVTLPYEEEASHSHGYKTVGYKYPETSIGWYRLHIPIAAEDEGKHIRIQFDGIFRNAQVWFNGIFMGVEPSGYATQTYEITDYINYGADNILTVRADASMEEGWFYEGAGIYRDAWLIKDDKVHVAPFGTFVYAEKGADDNWQLTVKTEVENSNLTTKNVSVRSSLEGTKLTVRSGVQAIEAKAIGQYSQVLTVENPRLWDVDDPYLYTVKTEVLVDNQVVSTYYTRTGFRTIEFTADEGFKLNGKVVKIKGVDMHQDHAGVGAAMPEALMRWRIKQLKTFGCNSYRASHNPMTPSQLDICDEEGILVMDENRLTGVNEYHKRLLENFIKRDRNHPSVIIWSDGNEEWGLEHSITGTRIAESMREITKRLDPTRPNCIANAGGTELIKGLEVVGYNYIIQNDVYNRREQHPEWKIVGTEETSGCGTRGVYFNAEGTGHMASLNRIPQTKDWKVDYSAEAPQNTPESYSQGIERGWKFYAETPWAAGCYWWTGFDYRGEPNPVGWPAHDSQFGLLDYCGNYKDEAWYLKSVWTSEPMVYALPHWNLEGHEGETIDMWVYSNCDEVQLTANGKNYGKKPMEKLGHLTFKVPYKAGKVVVTGYQNGKKVATQTIETTGVATSIEAVADRSELSADGQDCAIITVSLKDAKGRVVPTACNDLVFTIEGEGRILGAGNGDPACKVIDNPNLLNCKEFHFPAFNGYAQVIVQTTGEASKINVKINEENPNNTALRSCAVELQSE